MSKRLLLFINAKSRQGHRARDAIVARLQQLGFIVRDHEPIDAAHACSLVAEFQNEVDLVVVGGGDGTLISLIGALIDTKLPLGVIPLGTFNDLAKTLEIPSEMEAACDTIAACNTRQVDVGVVNGKYFINEASIGLSTRIARRQTTTVKRRFGSLAIVGTTLQTLRQLRPFRVRIEHSGGEESFRTIQLTVANSHHFGGWITNRRAAIDDGQLDLYSLELRRWLDVLPMIGALRKQDITNEKGLRVRRAPRFAVDSPVRSHEVFTDGEPATRTPATFEVLRRALTVIVPEK